MSKPYTTPTRIFDLLHQARRQSFIGRRHEIDLFKSIVFSPQPAKVLYYIHGPGGQGKTALLRHFGELCKEENCPYIVLDGRELEAHPSAVTAALTKALNPGAGQTIWEALAFMGDRVVLFMDTYEKLNPLEDWFRTEFFPQMPASVISVICSRKAPSLGWHADSGWKRLMEVVRLRNFSREESEVYLSNQNAPAEQVQSIMEFTHGHPLALSLVSDIFAHQPDKPFKPDESPDMVGALLEVFLQEIPGPAHRTALEVAALVNITTESVLTEVMELTTATELFEWLRQLSFMEQSKEGIYPQEVIREALIHDLRWRHPDYYQELYEKARLYYINKLNGSDAASQRKYLSSLVYLHRLHPMVRPFFDWQESGGHWIDLAHPEDKPRLVDMAYKHEGAESARILDFWLDHPAAQAWVWRDTKKLPAAFLLKINADEIRKDEDLPDPVVNKALQYSKTNCGLRSGEHLALFRYWMVRDGYQNVSSLQSSIFLATVQYYFTPGLAISMVACAQPAFWQQMFHYAGIQQIEPLDFSSGNLDFGWFMHDWRKQPVADWLDMLGKRGTSASLEETIKPSALQVLVLSEEAFGAAVSDALKYYRQRDNLVENPLIRSNLIIRQTGAEASAAERVATLQTGIEQCLKEIEQSPVDGKFHRVLYRTFINPVGSQEKVADFLNMSFSTYRRYLKTGIEKITELLWRQECSL